MTKSLKRRENEDKQIVSNMTPAQTTFSIPRNPDVPVVAICPLKPAEVRADAEQFFILLF